MKKILFLCLFLIVFVLAGCSGAVENTENDNIINNSSSPVVNKGGVQVIDALEEEGEPSSMNSLDLSGQGLKELPKYVLDMKNLQVLDISDNNLEGALPAEIRFLENLTKLDASYNKMTGIPAEIGQLSQLEELNFANNSITGMPLEIGNLKNLKVLNLSGNDYSEFDLGKIKTDLPDLNVISD
jgi:Leucine-rich repeat (LRR) protein